MRYLERQGASVTAQGDLVSRLIEQSSACASVDGGGNGMGDETEQGKSALVRSERQS